MMQICPVAEPLWRECVRSINDGTLEEYATAWHAYQTHKRECRDCKDHLFAYLADMDKYIKETKERYLHV